MSDDIEIVREALGLMFEIDEEEQIAALAALDRIEARLAAPSDTEEP